MRGKRPIGYNVHSMQDVDAMLATIGVCSIEGLFADVPDAVRFNRLLDLPEPVSEWELLREVRELAARNVTTHSHLCFLGGGAYEHYIPAVVDSVAQRGEFLTAYTPYQPEMSQGLLQGLHEFQIMIGRLLGVPSVNSSVYDGATALAEACWMMCSASTHRVILVSEWIWPQDMEVLQTYLVPRGVSIQAVPHDRDSGLIRPEVLGELLGKGGVAGVAVQTPNAMGIVEDVAAIVALCHQHRVAVTVSVNPMLCGWITAPGQLGADIVVCEGQPLGLPLMSGGPHVGVMGCTKLFERYLPGRLVGRVHDLNGRLAYALIKEDREQHVARDKATSHICSNQALNAIRIAAYLSSVGEKNFKEIAQANASLAHDLLNRLLTIKSVHRICNTGQFFNEFSLEIPMISSDFCDAMLERGLLAGLPLAQELTGHRRGILIAVTEMRSIVDIVRYFRLAKEILEP